MVKSESCRRYINSIQEQLLAMWHNLSRESQQSECFGNSFLSIDQTSPTVVLPMPVLVILVPSEKQLMQVASLRFHSFILPVLHLAVLTEDKSPKSCFLLRAKVTGSDLTNLRLRVVGRPLKIISASCLSWASSPSQLRWYRVEHLAAPTEIR